jgi:cytidyltransferase-like protein
MSHGTTVFVSGAFNVLHPGHLRLLRHARECGNRLLVAVLSDRLAGMGAHVPEQLRLEGVQSNGWVGEAFIVDEPVTDVIARLQPDVVCKGKEHESRFNAELAVLNGYGGRLLFSSGETVFSSVDLLRKEFSESQLRSIGIPHDYLERHGITTSRLRDLIQRFASMSICVVGDLIVDEYVTGEPLGMSQEDPTIVVTPVDTTRFIGRSRNRLGAWGRTRCSGPLRVGGRKRRLARVCFGWARSRRRQKLAVEGR